MSCNSCSLITPLKRPHKNIHTKRPWRHVCRTKLPPPKINRYKKWFETRDKGSEKWSKTCPKIFKPLSRRLNISHRHSSTSFSPPKMCTFLFSQRGSAGVATLKKAPTSQKMWNFQAERQGNLFWSPLRLEFCHCLAWWRGGNSPKKQSTVTQKWLKPGEKVFFELVLGYVVVASPSGAPVRFDLHLHLKSVIGNCFGDQFAGFVKEICLSPPLRVDVPLGLHLHSKSVFELISKTFHLHLHLHFYLF